jgi:membrane associated rhomboid family serine protease
MIRKNPVTKGILIINIFMYVLTLLFSGNTFLKSLWVGGDVQTLIRAGASLGIYVEQGQYYRLVSSLFLHGGLLHLFFNSYALYLFGTIVESVFGSHRFAVVYFISGLVGAILTQVFYPSVVSVGASGAIFGLIGLLFASGLRKNNPKRLTPVTGSALLPMIIMNLLLGFTVPGINNIAHIGGLATGFISGFILKPFEIPSKIRVYFWNAAALISIIICLVCISFVFLFPAPQIEQIVSFANHYAQLLQDLSQTDSPQKLAYYHDLLKPFDKETTSMTEQLRTYIDSNGKSPPLLDLQTKFKNWQEEVLRLYSSWIKKVP